MPSGAALDEPGAVIGGFMAVTPRFVQHGPAQSRPALRRYMLPEDIIRRLPSAQHLWSRPLRPPVLELRLA